MCIALGLKPDTCPHLSLLPISLSLSDISGALSQGIQQISSAERRSSKAEGKHGPVSHTLPGLLDPPPQNQVGDDEVAVGRVDRNREHTYIVILGEAEELADLGGALGAEALGVDDVGEAGDVGLALLDDGEGEDGEVHADDAATDGLALALTGAAGAVAGVSLGEKEADTGRVHNTLLHRETLLVVASGDAEDVALELVADGVTGDLSAHALLHEDAELALILNVDELLAAIGRVGDVQLLSKIKCQQP